MSLLGSQNTVLASLQSICILLQVEMAHCIKQDVMQKAHMQWRVWLLSWCT